MIFVTGGTGLVGSHLLFELAQSGKKVKALKRKTSDTRLVERLFKYYANGNPGLFEQIEWVDGDLEDFHEVSNLLQGVNEVYHCAAMVSFNRRDDKTMLRINAEATANLVDASLHAGVEKFCHVSSVAALGGTSDTYVDERALWGKTKGKNGYAISKFRGEMEVWRGYEMGLKTVIFLPSIIIGPGKWQGSSGNLLGTLSKGFPFYTTGITGYVDARDVVKCMITGMGKGLWGRRYVLNSENLSFKELFSMAAQAFGKKPPYISVKPWMGYLALPFIGLASLFTQKPPTISLSNLRSGYSKTLYSSQLVQNELGVSFIPIAESIANAVQAGSP